MAALDTKHLELFNVLSDRKFPFFIIKVIVNCYSKMFASVRWNGVFFNMLVLKSDVLQGSILSHSLFHSYVIIVLLAIYIYGLHSLC